jgi:hypothetical protein
MLCVSLIKIDRLNNPKKMKILSLRYKYLVAIYFTCIISACDNNTASFTVKQRALVKDSVQLMADSIAKNISREGPVAWLKYFENTPDFFMASDGQLVFPNIDTAKNFINNILIRVMPKIELRWTDIRVDPLTTSLAGISAVYHEDITDPAGKTTAHDGYFTGIACQTPQGWKLHNAHWSSLPTH